MTGTECPADLPCVWQLVEAGVAESGREGLDPTTADLTGQRHDEAAVDPAARVRTDWDVRDQVALHRLPQAAVDLFDGLGRVDRTALAQLSGGSCQ